MTAQTLTADEIILHIEISAVAIHDNYVGARKISVPKSKKMGFYEAKFQLTKSRKFNNCIKGYPRQTEIRPTSNQVCIRSGTLFCWINSRPYLEKNVYYDNIQK